jgi:ComF family protein
VSSVISLLREFIGTPMLDFIYPPLCFICGSALRANKERICDRCWGTLTTISPDHEVWQEISARFLAEGYVGGILSCFLFEKEGTMQQVVHLLKYQGMKSLGIRLGREIGERMLLNDDFRGADMLLPVPLHKHKMRERGYNQSELLCLGIAGVTDIPVETRLLQRIKHTRTQTKLSLVERKENVRGAFRLVSTGTSEIEGKRIVLVDDVVTTGSTINACAQVLRERGAKSVVIASAALAP